MSDYPGVIDSFRTLENDPGITYDAAKTKVVYAEDQTQRSSAIVAIEETLGTNPQGAYATVKAWLNALVTAIAGKQDSLGFTPENVANKDTTVTLGVSDTKYPSQKAVKTYADTGLALKQDSLGFTAENVANKSTNTSLGASDTNYPSQKAVKTYVDNQIANTQPLDSDLTTIAGLTATTDNFLQAKASAWASRTPAQVAVDIGKLLFPVGAIYIATVSTNPATLLGFGTWTATGVGRVLVGKAGSGTFGTAGATGGEETHLNTSAESGLKAHNHSITDPGHIHTYKAVNSASGNNGSQYPWLSDFTNRTPSTDTTTTGITINNNSASDAASAHNNLQPYLVVYMWERTA